MVTRDKIDAYLCGDMSGVVAEFLLTLQTYAEQSQSGNGIHLICRGTLPPGGRRKGKIEMYDSGRFFIMTGNAIGDYPYISDCTERIKPLHQKYFGSVSAPINHSVPPAVPTLSEQEIINKIINSQNGEKFNALYNGDFSDYPSQSEADMAFCSILAFWCSGNTDLMDRIYRTSGLMRDKWDRRQAGSTYGAITLNRAVASCHSFYEPQVQDDYQITIKNPSVPNLAPAPKLPLRTLDDTGNDRYEN